MPNTLAHIGLQGLLSRVVTPKADFKWICVGCVIPDLPWILQRAVWAGFGRDLVDLYDLRLYAIAQSTLAACLVLSFAAALLSSAPRRIFALLAFNSIVHLMLDALETKWANGVHFFAPFSWRLLNLGLWWPESGVVLGATICGVLYFFHAWWTAPGPSVELSVGLKPRTFAAMGLLLAYLAAPLLLMNGPQEADNHSVKVLRQRDRRTGKQVEFDRCPVVPRGDAAILRTFTGEELTLLGAGSPARGNFSVRGQFADNETVQVREIHQHSPWLRNGASMLGLALIGLLWLRWLRGYFRRRRSLVSAREQVGS